MSRRWNWPRRPPAAPGVVLHLLEDAKDYAERFAVERMVKAQSGHVPVPISMIESRAPRRPRSPTAALWTKPKSAITACRLYRFLSQHCRAVRRSGADRALPRRGAAGLYYVVLRAGFAAVRPVRSRSQGPHQALRQARVHHRRRRILPRYLRFVRGLVEPAPTCRSTSRARRSRKAPLWPRSRRARPDACSPSWSGSPTRSPRPTAIFVEEHNPAGDLIAAECREFIEIVYDDHFAR